jgi:L-seryl-tRNA(Ser) seleniumtransferase
MSPPSARPPSVERVLAASRPRLGQRAPEAVLSVARQVVDDERVRIERGAGGRPLDALAGDLIARLEHFADPRGVGLVPVINATGVLLHTNLGRAAWPKAAIEAAIAAASGQSLLELDRASGRRGSRFRAAEEHLMALTGAADALVTNNNAAALGLAVGLAGRKGVVVSRGELIEIGGGVRIPEIIRRAGARLIEVGTTNRTRAADFEAPLADGRAYVVLRVHASNFSQSGFVESPEPRALAELAHRLGAIVIDDLGSGALIDSAAYGLAHEPLPSERLAAGADVVTFSGDKLLGGPQAGLLVGRADLIARLRKDPLARAVRPDKVTLAALAATLGLYRAGLAAQQIPVWCAIATPVAVLRDRARAMVGELTAIGATGVSVVETSATIGGGSLPGETLPSVAVAARQGSAAALLARLRVGDPCVAGRVAAGAVLLDLRAVEPDRDPDLTRALAAALGLPPPRPSSEVEKG